MEFDAVQVQVRDICAASAMKLSHRFGHSKRSGHDADERCSDCFACEHDQPAPVHALAEVGERWCIGYRGSTHDGISPTDDLRARSIAGESS